MKAIQTLYKNYLFRSRLEARWAVFWDALQEPWEYETEGFDLDDGDLYLPDFYLPNLNCYVEIKGQSPTEREIRLCRKLQFHTVSGVAIFHGLPMQNLGRLFCWDSSDGSAGMGEWNVQWADRGGDGLSFHIGDGDYSSRSFFMDNWDTPFQPTFHEGSMRGLECAAIGAKQARFEHGEQHFAEKRQFEYISRRDQTSDLYRWYQEQKQVDYKP